MKTQVAMWVTPRRRARAGLSHWNFHETIIK